nr:hypothetical protein GCM10020093_108230 [Planobispora longispora]
MGHDTVTAGDPRQLGPYRITGRLGGGGQGIVYFAHSPDGTPVAVKVLREHIAEDAGVLALFAEEVQAAKRVSPSASPRFSTTT